MKKNVATAIIIGIIIIIAGIFICLGALLIASATNQQLFLLEKNADGNIVYTYDLSSRNVSSLSLDLSGKTQVNILHGESDYVEFINFPSGTFNTNVSARICTINDNLDFFTMIGMGETNKFGGIRNLLYNMLFSNKNQAINIYISPRSLLNSVNIQAESNVKITDVIGHTDIKINTNGDTIISGSELSSFVSVKASNIAIEMSAFYNFEAKSNKGNITLNSISAQSCKLNAIVGNIDAQINCMPELLSISAKCQFGSVTFNGEPSGHSLLMPSTGAQQTFEITVGKGNINILSQE